MPATIGFRSLRDASRLSALLLALAASASPAAAQVTKYDTSLYRGLVWREVGPFRGGRVTAVAGSSTQPLVYYMGGTGGGVWQTVDGGLTWHAASDKHLTAGSVGALAVAPPDLNLLYPGPAESPLIRKLRPGDRHNRSRDA